MWSLLDHIKTGRLAKAKVHSTIYSIFIRNSIIYKQTFWILDLTSERGLAYNYYC